MSFGSKVRPRTFGCVAMRSAVLYSAGSGVNRVHVVLSGFSVRLFCFVQEKLYVGMVVCISLMHSCLCVYMWWWCHLRRPWPELVLLVVVCLQCICWIVLVKGRHFVELQFWGCVMYICCVGFASLDVVWDKLNDCAWNVGL